MGEVVRLTKTARHSGAGMAGGFVAGIGGTALLLAAVLKNLVAGIVAKLD